MAGNEESSCSTELPSMEELIKNSNVRGINLLLTQAFHHTIQTLESSIRTSHEIDDVADKINDILDAETYIQYFISGGIMPRLYLEKEAISQSHITQACLSRYTFKR